MGRRLVVVLAAAALASVAVAGVGQAQGLFNLPYWKGSAVVYRGPAVVVKTKCTGDVNVITSCNGDVCNEIGSYACVPFTCAPDGLGCTASCTSTAQCGQGAACNPSRGECASYAGICVDGFTMKSPNGQLSSCAPYRCGGGSCLQNCRLGHPTDCVAGYACTRDSTGRYSCKQGG